MNTTSRCYRFGQWLGRSEVKAVYGAKLALEGTKNGALEIFEGTKDGHRNPELALVQVPELLAEEKQGAKLIWVNVA
jgi:hypothetical protein